ncbi:MAG: ketoacyl-ACP synthase III [Alphaproteobacteria bacterium]|nr:ketoacyl-ACP synthase III [Alphaproteobacteria bacterium]MBP7757841.1 ketoacyl-ACP synthase III [Alphaproteobacteria bacterium]MBP7760959.1 ketoacyl-ACP synthase III [Alphaproteobacteria bacterium]MBP7905267.1 ketoacyl-ACP synthase III [Alphaproteobacteria bacterium]
MSVSSIIRATGSYLPQRVMKNAELEKMVETSDEWIFERSGIRERRIAAENEKTSDLAVNAARAAMQQAKISPQEIDGIIVATTTPDQTFPSVAVMVQKALDIPVCTAFDVQAVCSGFVYALSIADNFIKAGRHRRILVIGAEKMSAIIDWTDRTTCVLFGDGAGAVILEASNEPKRGILSTHLKADGRYKDILYTDGGPSSTGTSGHIVMHGREVFKQAVTLMAEVVEEALKENNLTTAQIDWLVPHQANIRIIEATAKKLNLPMEKVVVTVERHGNTSAASIPLAFDEAMRSGRIKPGQTVLFEAMGGGLTWASALVRL